MIDQVRLLGVKYQLRLSDHRAQPSFRRFDRCLPHHGSSAAVQRRAFACNSSVYARGADKLRARVSGGRALVLRHVQERADGAKCVGERHVGPAVQNAASGA